jgi:hypothetical protein
MPANNSVRDALLSMPLNGMAGARIDIGGTANAVSLVVESAVAHRRGCGTAPQLRQQGQLLLHELQRGAQPLVGELPQPAWDW